MNQSNSPESASFLKGTSGGSPSGYDVTCQECVEFLMAYLDGELSPQERYVFEDHLRLCPPCVDYLNSYRETIQLSKKCFSESLCHELPKELVASILAARGAARS